MFPTNLSSKGQLTIPKKFRQRMKLTPRRRVFIEQRFDGSVLVRPAPSILRLAGTLSTNRSLLSPRAERRAMQSGLAKQKGARRG
jgi:bifunctional DNA-binding transcriptional regulator/antitoxin component of YhaV-PrlF toxin-antitoxin module